ncbi:hypothetical protein [Alcanivorax sp. 1008]|uniref:hypothetical protein n=1 Tax=Alcanivorax sp. 1008 TaxID=2816853 RepID=UPI001D642CB9|nr:hypothetical protein [Alcanivorax sp. 1008]MCC1498069.1 hypothetical protein [Alcanivorax sp. 1008]
MINAGVLKRVVGAIVVAFGCCLPYALADMPGAPSMQALDEAELEQVVARQGIMFDIRSRNNVDAANNPIGCVGALNPCRVGLEFTARAGKWLMLKDYYGTLEIESLRLDAAFLSAGSSPYFDASRFLAADGVTCLVVACNPSGAPGIMFTYPENKGAGVYNDLTTFLNIGRVAIEFDSGLTPGYMRDVNTGSVLAFRASDASAPNASMQMRFDGRAIVYGF